MSSKETKKGAKKGSDKGSEKETQPFTVKIVNTDKKPEDHETWLDYWRTKADSTRKSCPITECSKPIAKGVIVRITNKEGDEWYVIPVCKEHSNCKGEMTVEPATKLIPVSKQTMKKKDPEAKFKKANKPPNEEESDPKKPPSTNKRTHDDSEDDEDNGKPTTKKAKTEGGAKGTKKPKKEDKPDKKKGGKKK